VISQNRGEFRAYHQSSQSSLNLNLSDYFSQIANHNMWGATYFPKIQDYPF
jgi:hypothetical protein